MFPLLQFDRFGSSRLINGAGIRAHCPHCAGRPLRHCTPLHRPMRATHRARPPEPRPAAPDPPRLGVLEQLALKHYYRARCLAVALAGDPYDPGLRVRRCAHVTRGTRPAGLEKKTRAGQCQTGSHRDRNTARHDAGKGPCDRPHRSAPTARGAGWTTAARRSSGLRRYGFRRSGFRRLGFRDDAYGRWPDAALVKHVAGARHVGDGAGHLVGTGHLKKGVVEFGVELLVHRPDLLQPVL